MSKAKSIILSYIKKNRPLVVVKSLHYKGKQVGVRIEIGKYTFDTSNKKLCNEFTILVGNERKIVYPKGLELQEKGDILIPREDSSYSVLEVDCLQDIADALI